MSSIHDLPSEGAPLPAARGHLRLVPEQPLDFDAAVRTLTPRLQRYALRRLGDRHEAEEVVQEALLRAYKHRGTLLTEDDVTAWSTVVTGRLVIDRLRVRGRSTSVADVPETGRVGRDTADVVVARDEARTALDALDAMPARQAAVLWAREVEGLPYDQIGIRFGMTEPAVRSILTRARKALRKEYEARGGTLPAAGLGVLAPWADGYSWVQRLREAMERLAAPAAAGAIGVVVVVGGVFSPFSPFSDDPAVAQPRPTTAIAAAAAVDTAAEHGAPRVLRGADGHSHAAPATPGSSGSDLVAFVSDPRNGDCVMQDDAAEVPGEHSGTGVNGAGCTREGERQTRSTLYVGPPLPDNPTGIRRVAISSFDDEDQVPVPECFGVPDSPVTQCETPQEAGSQ